MKKLLIVLLSMALIFPTTSALANGAEFAKDNSGEKVVYQLTDEEMRIYLSTGKLPAAVNQPTARIFTTFLAKKVAGKIIDVIVTKGIDAAISALRGGSQGTANESTKTYRVKVLHHTFDSSNYTTWACDTCANSSFYVDLLQRALTSISYNVGGVDGYWGPNTKSGLLQFQRAAGIAQDGSSGPSTWKKLSHD